MAAIIRIEVTQSGGIDKLKSDVESIGSSAEKAGGGFNVFSEMAVGAARAAGEAMLNLAGAAISKVTEVIGDSITAARESNMVAAQTAQVIKSTGAAAGVTTQHVLDYASALSAASGKSLFGDEQIAESTNLLLTFTNIKDKTLDAATAISVDMAQALGGAPKDAAIQLGKALNDPIKGVTALTRVGVSFSEEQKAQIQAMVEHNNVAGAQAIILGELNKEFGGSAAAAAAADGGFAQFHDRLGEMEETIGKAILPILGQLVGFLNDSILPVVESAASTFGDLANYFTATVESGDPLNDYFANLPASIQPVVEVIGTFLPVAMDYISTTVIPSLIAAWGTIQPALATVADIIINTVIPAIGGIVSWFQTQIPVAIGILTTYWNTSLLPIFNALVDLYTAHLAPALSLLFGWFQDNLPAAINTLVSFWTGTLQPVIAFLAQFIATTVIPAIGLLVDWLAKNLPVAIQTVATFWTGTLQPALNSVWAFIQNSVIPILSQVFTWLKTTIPPALVSLAAFWTGTLQPALNAVWAFIQNYVIPILTTLVKDNIKIVEAAVRLLGEVWTNVLKPALSAVWDYIDKNIMPILKSVGNDISTVLTPIVKAISDMFSNTFTKSLDDAKGAIGPVEGAIKSVGDAIDGAIKWVQKFIDKLDDIHIPPILKQQSPSPLEQSLIDVGRAAQEVASTALPAFIGGFQGIQGALPGLVNLIDDIGSQVVEANKKWKIDVVNSFHDSINAIDGEIEKLGNSISNTINDAFLGAASLDRAKARAIDTLKDIGAAQQANVQAQLAGADEIASKMSDPAAAAKYFKMRSDQIFELAKLQSQLVEGTDPATKAAQLAALQSAENAQLTNRANRMGTETAKIHALFDPQIKAVQDQAALTADQMASNQRIQDQIALITDAQKNEMAGTAKSATSPAAALIAQLSDLKMKADSVLRQGGSQFSLPAELDGNPVINALRALTNQLSMLTSGGNSSIVTSSNSVFNYAPTITTSAAVTPAPAATMRALANV